MLSNRLLLGVAMILSSTALLVLADDFRIETKVYVGKEKQPVAQTTTLFQAGMVYDYLNSPAQVAVFDQQRGRFVLLDPATKRKTEVKTEDVLTFAERCQSLASHSSSSFLKFAADPQFETDFSADGELTLASKYINYKLQTQPASTPEAAQQYRDFSDWYARFNAMANPESTPPFARLVVNKELAERGLVPTEVHLTTTAPGRGVTMRSEHHVAPRLLKRDEERIAETATQLATFKTVTFTEFKQDKVSKK